jgi:glycosyltransferase involved in cell wall biosynthesis
MFSQSVSPTQWIVVDTGSTDGTQDVVEKLATTTDWIVATAIDEAAVARGGPIVRAFSHGLRSVVPPTDVVVKLDADISFEVEFFEELLARFRESKRLGIAGGPLYELENGEWRRQYGTDNFIRGACRAYRWQCLAEILPLEERIGWDGLDLVKARVGGWSTEQFEELPIFHHRAVGGRERSQAAAWYAMGDAMHYMGYRPTYAFAAAVFNTANDIRAATSFAGFTMAAIRRKPRHPDPRVRAYVRSRQRLRDLPSRTAEKLGRR